MDDIRERIFTRRKERIAQEGAALGASVPELRRSPVIPAMKVLEGHGLICEIKKASPSRGSISEDLDVLAQASLYMQKGIRVVSVLTEEDHFHGSLEDLIAIKREYPQLVVLRKDFLYSREDIDISYRSGADLVLLIASLLSSQELEDLYSYALSYGITPLVEIHDLADVEKVSSFEPLLTGINSRDLKSFTIDRQLPLRVKELVDWSTRFVYESGISTAADATYAASAGFGALLMGETAVRFPDRIEGIAEALAAESTDSFFSRLFERKRAGCPLVKVCGITRREDAELALELGADLLGFVFAPSVRKARAELLQELAELRVLKVGVVVSLDEDDPDSRAAIELYDQGLLDALQLHGLQSDETERIGSRSFYQALRIRGMEDLEQMRDCRSPRVLIDAYDRKQAGGTGKKLGAEIIEGAAGILPVWLAGGLGPENIAELLESCEPELLDLSSGLEASPGVKDRQKMERFFQEIGKESI